MSARTAARAVLVPLVMGSAVFGVLSAWWELWVVGGWVNASLLTALVGVAWMALGRPVWGAAAFGIAVLVLGDASVGMVACVWVCGAGLVLARALGRRAWAAAGRQN